MADEVFGPRILWEIPVQLCLKDFLRPGDCAFDVGANIGGISVALSRAVGPRGRVHAFEANSFLLPRLRDNLAANRAANVEVVPKAVYSKSGEQLKFYCENSFYASGSSLYVRDATATETVVETISLDDYCAERNIIPKTIKIDVEGGEYAVLLGAKRLIQKHEPVFVLEYRAPDAPAEDPCELLRRAGYVLYDTNLYRQVDRSFYLSSFAQPPLVNVLAIPPRQSRSSAYSSLSIHPVRSLDCNRATPRSQPISVRRRGRYLVHIDFDAPASSTAGLKVETAAGELLAYYEAGVPHLRQHSCSNLVFELYGPGAIVCEIVPRGADKAVSLQKVTVSRIELERPALLTRIADSMKEWLHASLSRPPWS